MEQKLLILDIDETLLYSCFSYKIQEKVHDFIFDKFFVHKRPHLDKFLNFCFENFEVAVWSAASKDYVDFIVSNIFVEREKLKFVWSRYNCTEKTNYDYFYSGSQTVYVKNFSKLRKKGFSLSNVIGIDDKADGYNKNYGNLIKLKPYEGGQNDSELLYLMEYLKTLKDVPDIRNIEKRGWRNKYNQEIEKNMILAYTIKSEMGVLHRTNEDSCGVKALPPYKLNKAKPIDLDKGTMLICLGDGVGGGKDGDVASEIVIKTAKYYFSASYLQKYTKQELLELIMLHSHKKIIKYADEHRIDWIGTTAVIGIFERSKLYLGWIGDSRAYVIRKGKLSILSWDHTYLWDRLKKGEISEEEAWTERHSAKMRLCLGDDLTYFKPDYKEFVIEYGDIFLFCTDGLTGEVQDKEIELILQNELSLQEKYQLLHGKAIENGSGDDITIFLGKIL